jgi:hypothetical protein
VPPHRQVVGAGSRASQRIWQSEAVSRPMGRHPAMHHLLLVGEDEGMRRGRSRRRGPRRHPPDSSQMPHHPTPRHRRGGRARPLADPGAVALLLAPQAAGGISARCRDVIRIEVVEAKTHQVRWHRAGRTTHNGRAGPVLCQRRGRTSWNPSASSTRARRDGGRGT